MDKAYVHSARIPLRFRHDSATFTASNLHEICVKSSCCMETSMDKA